MPRLQTGEFDFERNQGHDAGSSERFSAELVVEQVQRGSGLGMRHGLLRWNYRESGEWDRWCVLPYFPPSVYGHLWQT